MKEKILVKLNTLYTELEYEENNKERRKIRNEIKKIENLLSNLKIKEVNNGN